MATKVLVSCMMYILGILGILLWGWVLGLNECNQLGGNRLAVRHIAQVRFVFVTLRGLERTSPAAESCDNPLAV